MTHIEHQPDAPNEVLTSPGSLTFSKVFEVFRLNFQKIKLLGTEAACVTSVTQL